jgi:CRP-like cAMP-binding protein
MIDALRQHLLTRLDKDSAGLETVLSHFKPQEVQRGQDLVNQGQVCRFVYFVVRGALQVYVLNRQYHESTRDIALDGSWVSDLSSFATQQASQENIRALENSELLAISSESFQLLLATVPAFGHIYQRNLEVSFASSSQRVTSLVAMTALEKVQWLHAEKPHFVERVPSKILASYLGLAQETYSRIKTKLALPQSH